MNELQRRAIKLEGDLSRELDSPKRLELQEEIYWFNQMADELQEALA